MTTVYTVRSCNLQWTGSNANRKLIPFSHGLARSFSSFDFCTPHDPIHKWKTAFHPHTRFMKLLSESEMICCKSVICYFTLVACRQTVRYLSCGAEARTMHRTLHPHRYTTTHCGTPYTVVCLHTIRLINVACVDFSVLFCQIPAVIGLRLGIIKFAVAAAPESPKPQCIRCSKFNSFSVRELYYLFHSLLFTFLLFVVGAVAFMPGNGPQEDDRGNILSKFMSGVAMSN